MNFISVAQSSGFFLVGLISMSVLAADVETPVQAVIAAAIEQAPITHRVSTYGTMSPKTEELSFKINGRIASFKVEEGDTVSAGQLLAQLETRDSQDAVDKQKVELDQTQRNLNRMETLFKNKSIQRSQLEDARDKFEQVRIAFEQAQLNLQRCHLLAPGDGLILKEFLDSRTTVSAGQSIYSFLNHSAEWITKVNLTDRNAIALGEGAKARIRFAPYPGLDFEGELTKLARVANVGDSLYTAELKISTAGYDLRPGMVAEVDLFQTSTDTFYFVPFDALLDIRGVVGTIYLINDTSDSVSERRVTIESVQGAKVALKESLLGFSQVVVRGHTNLGDGSPVVVIDSN